MGAVALCMGACADEPQPPRHLLLVSVDTLRADRIDGERMPHVDALARESQYFERAWATAPFTLPSIATLFTGRHPVATGVRANLARLPVDLPTLATRLSGIRFATGAVVSSSVLTEHARLSRGFDLYDVTLPSHEAHRRLVRERRATATTDAALKSLDALRERGERVFLWVHYQDPHGPYTPPPAWLERMPQLESSGRRLPIVPRGVGGIPRYQLLPPVRDPAVYRRRYDAETRYVDHEIGRLLEALRERGLWEEAAIVLTADHGESLGEQDYWFQHGALLNEASLRIPLLVRIPGRQGRVREDEASLMDVVPTLASVFGFPADDLRGRDLLAPGAEDRKRPVFFSTWTKKGSSRGILWDGYKLVRSTRGEVESEALYRMPDEDRNLARESPERLAALSAALDAHFAALDRRSPQAPPPLREERREALRAMGYLEDRAR